MKKWAIPLAAAAIIAVSGVAVATYALIDAADDDAPRAARDAGDSDESGGDGTAGDVTRICLEGAVDCDDTIDIQAMSASRSSPRHPSAPIRTPL